MKNFQLTYQMTRDGVVLVYIVLDYFHHGSFRTSHLDECEFQFHNVSTEEITHHWYPSKTLRPTVSLPRKIPDSLSNVERVSVLFFSETLVP